MSDKTISAADLAKLSDALKAARPVPSGDCQGLMIESAAGESGGKHNGEKMRKVYGYISTINNFPNPSVILHLWSLETIGKENILLASPDEVMVMAQARKATGITFHLGGLPRHPVEVEKSMRHLKKLFAN